MNEATGVELTLMGNVTVVLQLVTKSETEYLIESLPNETGVTVPLLSTVAIALLVLVQVPPVVVSANDIAFPKQTLALPVIGPTTGTGFTETVSVAAFLQP